MSTATLPRPKAPKPKPKSQISNPKSQILNLPQLIALKNIDPDPRNPRLEAAADVKALAGSLEKLDLLNPLTVRPGGQPGRYVLVAGERRFHAAAAAGWQQIPAFVRDVDDAEAAEMMVAENLQQKRLNPIEVARSYALLCGPIETGGAGLSRLEVAKMMGYKDCSPVRKYLHLLRLPEAWQGKVARAELSVFLGHAISVAADRPDVLGAIDADMKANPQDWRESRAVHGRIRDILSCLDNLPAATAPAAIGNGVTVSPLPTAAENAHRSVPPAHASQESPARDCPEMPAVPLRRSAPVDHADPEAAAEHAVLQILELIGLLTSKEHLARIDDAINRRDEQLTAELTAARHARNKPNTRA